jgi:A/G-specific adenine glycosylase
LHELLRTLHNYLAVIVTYTDEKAKYFRSHLAVWGARHRRDFPWRRTNNPFHILLAEMMLRRTNAPQVIPTYLDIIRRYPDPESLATAPIQNVLETLRPLGLAWRAENIRHMAEALTERFDGLVPSTYEELIELPGVGDYVASAVCCFAFGKPLPIIDTNTVRVAGRYFGFPTHAESRRRSPVRKTIAAITSRRNTREFNYAFLDFAALVCKANKPECPTCPLRRRCIFGQERLGMLRCQGKQ